jgi:hypothetical protein
MQDSKRKTVQVSPPTPLKPRKLMCRSAVERGHVVQPARSPTMNAFLRQQPNDYYRNLAPVRIIAAAIPEPSSRVAPIFVERSGYGAILDIVYGTTDRHYHVPTTTEKALATKDIKYLEAKGCFRLTNESKELIKAYFQLVHPSFPVLDGSNFLQQYSLYGL